MTAEEWESLTMVLQLLRIRRRGVVRRGAVCIRGPNGLNSSGRMIAVEYLVTAVYKGKRLRSLSNLRFY